MYSRHFFPDWDNRNRYRNRYRLREHNSISIAIPTFGCGLWPRWVIGVICGSIIVEWTKSGQKIDKDPARHWRRLQRDFLIVRARLVDECVFRRGGRPRLRPEKRITGSRRPGAPPRVRRATLRPRAGRTPRRRARPPCPSPRRLALQGHATRRDVDNSLAPLTAQFLVQAQAILFIEMRRRTGGRLLGDGVLWRGRHRDALRTGPRPRGNENLLQKSRGHPAGEKTTRAMARNKKKNGK